MGPVGVQEMIVIFLVALVLFGPKKLPELGRTVGKAITEFRRAQSELKATLEHHMTELERENDSIKEVTRNFNNEIMSHYDSPSVEPYHSYESSSLESNPTTPSAPAIESATETVSHGNANPGTVPRTSQAGYPADAASTPESNPIPS
ncbi:MAG TPA: twin-arginine translocase TatA/TatE family subunit [Bryobacteraceae bacterium]|jgi:sec-independent protein translocase protein TatA|nr:twin-arginine translocase TatA/TatE family subunit [Bryobacteraceae bacterium]